MVAVARCQMPASPLALPTAAQRCGCRCRCRALLPPLGQPPSHPPNLPTCPPHLCTALPLPLANRTKIIWLGVALDILSTISLLFAITWFTEAVGAKSDGTTSDAARAIRIVRLVRVVTVLEIRLV